MTFGDNPVALSMAPSASVNLSSASKRLAGSSSPKPEYPIHSHSPTLRSTFPLSLNLGGAFASAEKKSRGLLMTASCPERSFKAALAVLSTGETASARNKIPYPQYMRDMHSPSKHSINMRVQFELASGRRGAGLGDSRQSSKNIENRQCRSTLSLRLDCKFAAAYLPLVR